MDISVWFVVLALGVGFAVGFISGVIALYIYAASRGFKRYKEELVRHEEFMEALEQELENQQVAMGEAAAFSAFQERSPNA